MTDTVTVGQTYTINQTGFKLTNLTFVTWNTKPDGSGITYPPGRKITVTGPLVLYAQYTGKILSPIILDLDGGGVKTTSLDNGVTFDFAGTGNPIRTAWADPSCGFLVRDLNGNGEIDNGSEMFGNLTLLKNGELADNGFQALAELDLNGDSVVTKTEADTAGLLIWRDANTNGKVDPGELLTFEDAGVQSIQTRYATIQKEDENGNLLLWHSIFTRSSGAKAYCVDVLFVTE